jgi:3-phenylpropionate/cinnamic acid dioxygenase small subunit
MTNFAEDKIAIQELSSIYANAMDSGDIELWLATWAENGIWEGGGGRYEGKKRLAELLPDLGERIKFKRHVMSNFVIDVDGDSAKQTCYLLIVDRTKKSLPVSAVYDDNLRKENGKWQFVHRKVSIDQ